MYVYTQKTGLWMRGISKIWSCSWGGGGHYSTSEEGSSKRFQILRGLNLFDVQVPVINV